MRERTTERTTVVLDERTCTAARQLARRYGCSVSEAIRRSVRRQHDSELGASSGRRRERTAALRKLFRLFEGNDPSAEVKRLKAEFAGIPDLQVEASARRP